MTTLPLPSSSTARAPRHIAVVGGAGGIGRALVRRLLAGGDRVAVLDLPASLRRHPVHDTVHSIAVDLTDATSVARALGELEQWHPALDGCVNLVGFGHPTGPAQEIPDTLFTEVLDGNLTGVFRWAKAVIPLLRAGSSPSLVHLASGLGGFIRPHHAAYAAAKAGLVALTKTLALELAPGIRVNAVAPAAVDTAFLRGGTGRSEESNSSLIDLATYVHSIPLRRVAVPEDVVGPIHFLLGPDAGYVTGQVLWVNGGLYLP